MADSSNKFIPKKIDYPLMLANQLALQGIPSPTFEYKFHDKRKWRLDLCWLDVSIAVEVNGGVWTYGRHNRAATYIEDLYKLNEATRYGFKVFQFITEQVESGQAAKYMLNVFDAIK